MKTIIQFLAIALVTVVAPTTFAGGGAASFKTHGLPTLNQSPLIAEMLTSRLSIEEKGVFGPSDAPFDGMRRYYQMDFRATEVGKEGQSFLIRLHFIPNKNGILSSMNFRHVEIFPVPVSVDASSATFNDLQKATGANKTADSAR